MFANKELTDNNVKVSTDLFQQYFNMSVSVAGEMMFIEEKEQELEEMMADLVRKGNSRARDMIRRKEEGGEVDKVYVKNAATKQLTEMLTGINNDIERVF